MNKYSHILATLFSFFIAFFLFLGILIGTMKLTVINQRYLLNSLDDCSYYQGIADALNTDFMQGAGAAGFEAKIFENFVTVEDVHNVSRQYILESFENGIAEVKTELFQKKLSHYLHEVAKEAQMKLTDVDEKRLEAYIDINVQAYQQYLSFPFLQYMVMGFDMMNNVVPFILIACLILVSLAFYFLRRLHLDNENKTVYQSSILFAVGLMLIIPCTILFIGKYIQRIQLTPEFYYRFFVYYIEGYFQILILCGITLFICGILIILMNQRKRIKSGL